MTGNVSDIHYYMCTALTKKKLNFKMHFIFTIIELFILQNKRYLFCLKRLPNVK